MQEKILNTIESIESKKSKFYFFAPDTDGNVTGGVKYICDCAMGIQSQGYEVFLFHEKPQYKIPPMGSTYGELNFISFKTMNTDKRYLLTAADFIFVGELYVQGLVGQMVQSKIPSKIVVISQAYDYIFQHMDIGMSWDLLGINDVLTTSKAQKEYIGEFMPMLDTQVVHPFIPSCFRPPEKPQKPYIAIVSRFPPDGDKLIKQFYLKYPLFSWVPFKALGQMSQEDFASELRECCMGVWLDEIAGFGTFPLECMRSGVPLVAQVPSLIPEYAIEDNRLATNAKWATNRLSMVDKIADTLDEFLHNTGVPIGYEVPYVEERFKKEISAYTESLVAKRIKQLKTHINDNSNTDSPTQ